ncbi:MAG: alpha/beta hydrolase [Anaerolineae bacterium]|nr:alpha/beta hydrolase [Anaerolineae bacterium]MDW8300568.1 alpha/beta hydrolase [Anaerolineae bacterium]
MQRKRRFLRLLLVFAIILIALMIVPFFLPVTAANADPHTLADPNGVFITLNGGEVYYIAYGDENAPAVVFLHGLFGSTFTWRKNLEVVAAAGYRAIAFDRFGAGLSDKRESLDFSHAAGADLTAALLDALKIERATIVGHSAGGNVLAHFALRYPERVDKLVIVDGAIIGPSGPPPFISALVAFPPINRWARVLLGALLTESRLAEAVEAFYVKRDWLTEADLAGYWRPFQAKDWDVGLVGLVRDSATNRLSDNQVARLAQFAPRTLIIWGEADTVTPFEIGRELAQRLSGAQFISYSGVGHQPMEELSDAFNRDLIAFLAR